VTAYEVMERSSILANVDLQRVRKQNKLTDNEVLNVVKARAGMFQESDQTVLDFLRHRDRFKFEEQLVRNHQLKEDNENCYYS